jgi:hypothetical protein
MSKTACFKGNTENSCRQRGSVNSIPAWATSQPRSWSTSVIASHTLRARLRVGEVGEQDPRLLLPPRRARTWGPPSIDRI